MGLASDRIVLNNNKIASFIIHTPPPPIWVKPAGVILWCSINKERLSYISNTEDTQKYPSSLAALAEIFRNFAEIQTFYNWALHFPIGGNFDLQICWRKISIFVACLKHYFDFFSADFHLQQILSWDYSKLSEFIPYSCVPIEKS